MVARRVCFFVYCMEGNYTNSSFSLGNGSTVQAFALYSNQNFLVLASNSQVFRFSSAMGSTLLGMVFFYGFRKCGGGVVHDGCMPAEQLDRDG